MDTQIVQFRPLTVPWLRRLGQDGAPFVAHIRIPELKINARYTSSGVLIILPASGQGNFHSTLGMCKHSSQFRAPCISQAKEVFFFVEKRVSSTAKERSVSLAPQSFGRVGYSHRTKFCRRVLHQVVIQPEEKCRK